MTNEVEMLYREAFFAKELLRVNEISYDEAKKRIMPYINKYNEVSKEKAKKFKVRPLILSFSSFIR